MRNKHILLTNDILNTQEDVLALRGDFQKI